MFCFREQRPTAKGNRKSLYQTDGVSLEMKAPKDLLKTSISRFQNKIMMQSILVLSLVAMIALALGVMNTANAELKVEDVCGKITQVRVLGVYK
jgi:hypothetical protein